MPVLPKHPAARARTNRTPGARTLVVVPGAKWRRPALPKDRQWHPATRVWWRDVWASPMAPEYDPSDRHGLFLLAALVDDFWTAESGADRRALAAEIRLQRQVFGLSPLDRRRLSWEIDRGDQAERKVRARRAADRPASLDASDPRAQLLG